MDPARFETILHSLATSPSRRDMLRLLAGSALAGSLPLGTQPSQAKRRGKGKGKGKVTLCHTGQTIRVSKKAKKRHLKHGDTRGACRPVVTYKCPGPSGHFIETSTPATARFAQTFTASQSGPLQQIQFEVNKAPDTTRNYLVELLAASSGAPTNVLLAAANIASGSVPNGDSTLTATFSGPPLTAGTEYAAALSRPGGSQLQAPTRDGCTGQAFFQNPSGSGPFEGIGSRDFITAVTVLA